MPGEKARSHRHTPNALRLVLDAAPGAYTIVNGKRLPMAPNDVVLTPNWCWHGHGNDGKGRAYLARFPRRAAGASARPDVLRAASRRVRGRRARGARTRRCIFPWRDTERRLAAAAPDPTGRHGISVELGDPALDTMALSMMRLAPGEATPALPHHRQQALCRGRGRGHHHRRGQALRLGARRRGGGADLAHAFPPRARRRRAVPRHRRAGDGPARLPAQRSRATLAED